MAGLAKYADSRDDSDAAILHLLPPPGAGVATVDLEHSPELWLDGGADSGRVMPRVKYRGRRWLLEIADELRARGSERGARRADRLSECTRYVRVKVCHCGRPSPARLGSSGVERCHSRSCPRCGPQRADEYRARIRAWMESDAAPKVKWWHLQFTGKYEPWNPADLTVEAIRSRVDLIKRQWRKWWRKHRAAAALTGMEIGRWGQVHLHVMITGDRRPHFDGMQLVKDENGREYWRAELPTGYVRIPVEPIDDPARNVGELVKYAAKVPAKGATWWKTPVVLPNPRLIARWELATWGARLVERYGLARQLPEAEKPEAEPELCDVCGDDLTDAREFEYGVRFWVGFAETHGITPFHRLNKRE